MTNRAALRSLFSLALHGSVRDIFPAGFRAAVQDGMIERVFQDALLPEFLFTAVATNRPIAGRMGDTVSITRTGLLAAATTPVTGSDPVAATYGLEQYTVTLEQYANAMDTNMLGSQVAVQSKYLEDIQKLGINAGQTLNQLARNALFGAYAGGTTYATAAGAASTTLSVADTSGFATVLVNGVPTAVSATNVLAITIDPDGTPISVNVTASTTTSGPGDLTLDAAQTWADGDAVVASTAPSAVFAGASSVTGNDIQAANVATFADFREAVKRLRTQNVPTLGGAYAAHISPTTEAQLFADSEFQALYAGAVESPVWRDLALGRFGGIDWVRNNEAPTADHSAEGGAAGGTQRALVVGADALIAGPLENTASLLSEVNGEGSQISPVQAAGLTVALIGRKPQDRLQQVVSTAWSWIGGFGLPSDSVTGDSARYKRAVMVEHAT